MIFTLHIRETLKNLLIQEDTDGDKKITIEDKGPKEFVIRSTSGENYPIKGTYYLSNLLQELVRAKNKGLEVLELDIAKIEELPVARISRSIKDYYWQGLTRTMDEKGIEALLSDTKNDTLTDDILKIYIPFEDVIALQYYQQIEKTLPIEAIQLPKIITPEFVKSINTKPGILALKLTKENDNIQGVPFVVPGGRFNEMYGWDSYFESIGLIIDGKVALAKAMADNFQYEIEHYGKILNANRSYYLTRTQPPFYTSLIREIYEVTQDKEWLRSHLKTAIKEYETVWMVEGKRLTKNGLNRFIADGLGVPPECEVGHFDAILSPFAKELNISIENYIEGYQNGEIKNNELAVYFLNDRSVRESGHDTSYRIDGNCSELNLVDLNAFLYKYETDFKEIIASEFDDTFSCNNQNYTSNFWNEKAKKRKQLSNTYLWDEEKGMYFDYNIERKEASQFISATTLTPLWSKMASKKQAEKLVKTAIPLLKMEGGIAGSTQESAGEISTKRPQRQWDFPNGWAPHQMLIWKGLLHYKYKEEAQELIYRWLYMITKNAVDYNGTIPEKYNVVSATHKVFAEYGNVGTDFEYITDEGFGWMNASYQYGLTLLNKEYKQHLNKLTIPNKLFKND
ncbi:MAG: alpha,alpha-trehalase [Arenicella sp.]|jgi:alpha,alpha-trehalase